MDNVRLEDFISRFERLEQDIADGKIRSDKSMAEARVAISEVKELVSEYEESLKAEFRNLEVKVTALDRDVIEQKSLYSNIAYKLDLMDKRIGKLETAESDARNSQEALLEKIALAVIGGIITYIVSTL